LKPGDFPHKVRFQQRQVNGSIKSFLFCSFFVPRFGIEKPVLSEIPSFAPAPKENLVEKQVGGQHPDTAAIESVTRT
jgi:hypothetical protein